MKLVLDVGSGGEGIEIPDYYKGWKCHRLDIDIRVNPDVLMDARELRQSPPGIYDAVYCSHNLEHYSRADGTRVLQGFSHILKSDGFADIRVPNILGVIQYVAQHGLDLDDTLYESNAGPITVRNVLYGYELPDNEFFAHKTGFSVRSLTKFISGCGFSSCATLTVGSFDLVAFLFKSAPTLEQWTMLKLDPAQLPVA